MLNILFLCTGNSCRSIMAEAILNHYGYNKFRAYSAGSFPTGEVHPISIKTLKANNILNENFYSKSWDEFNNIDVDIVITVCNNAENETCPLFLGKAIKAHWGVPDPAKFADSEEEITTEFNRIFYMLKKHITDFINLPTENMSQQELEKALHNIGLSNEQ